MGLLRWKCFIIVVFFRSKLSQLQNIQAFRNARVIFSSVITHIFWAYIAFTQFIFKLLKAQMLSIVFDSF